MPDATGADQRLLWGLILAAGDGRRMEQRVRELKGKNLPKQYINFVGRRSMLEHTFQRVERLIPADHILTVVSEQHLDDTEVNRQLNKRPHGTIIVQPENKETGPGILLPLMFLHKRCPEATVAVFPSDHFILEEDRFINYIRLANRAIDHNPSCILLLAVEAHEPKTEYGYILPRNEVIALHGFGARQVAGFVEKPCVHLALELMLAGGLWNTMTMVFKLKTLLGFVRMYYPNTYRSFRRIQEAIGTPRRALHRPQDLCALGADQLF
jgi:mannose-1-phosphate guanylyltransferase